MNIPAAGYDRATKDLRAAKALKAFFNIADRWGLSTDEQMTLLGSIPRSTYFKLKKEGGVISDDMLERISYVIGIYSALQIIFPDPGAADAWVRKPNSGPLFNGQSALERMLGGRVADLY